MTGIRNESFGTDKLDQGAGGQRVLCPFDLQVWAVDRMLNFEIPDDPDYEAWSSRCSTTQSTAGG